MKGIGPGDCKYRDRSIPGFDKSGLLLEQEAGFLQVRPDLTQGGMRAKPESVDNYLAGKTTGVFVFVPAVAVDEPDLELEDFVLVVTAPSALDLDTERGPRVDLDAKPSGLQ